MVKFYCILDGLRRELGMLHLSKGFLVQFKTTIYYTLQAVYG
jgi:hypothetical protein